MKSEYEETIESEEYFVGMILSDPDCAAQLDQYPNREWFYSKNMGKICEAISKSNTVDHFEISDLTGIPQATLLKLQLDAPISHNPRAYAKTIYNNFKGREVSTIARKWLGVVAYSKSFFQSVDTDINTLKN